jgi:hypothetical protein
VSELNTDDLRLDWNRVQDFIATRRKVFIVGSPKSGTTWLMNQLNGHPQMVVRGEGRFTWRLVPYLAQAFKKFNDDQEKHGGDPCTVLRDVDLMMCARTLIDIQLCRYIESSGRAPHSVAVVGDKTPQHAQSIDLLAQLYPGAKFIHILRDPRDAATSGWHHFGPDSQREQRDYLAHFVQEIWPTAVNAARASAAQIPARYLEVRYEDLHAREAHHVRRCLEFLCVDASAESVEACIAAGSFKARSGGRERGEEDSKNFYRRGIVGDWAHYLTPEDAATICAPVGPLMRSCGYNPASGLSPGVEVNMRIVNNRDDVPAAQAA